MLSVILILVYAQTKFPIPYKSAIAFSEVLAIDATILFDDFARFLDFPNTEKLRAGHQNLCLSQKRFAEKAEIRFSIFTKWESGSRQPSRKMYQKLAAAYSELIK